MSNGRDKYQSRENRARVRNLFLREWDPIGLFRDGPTDCPDDEYDAYANKSYAMLMDEQAGEAEIAEYLYRAATEYIGMSNLDTQRSRSERTAKLLVAMRPSFGTH